MSKSKAGPRMDTSELRRSLPQTMPSLVGGQDTLVRNKELPLPHFGVRNVYFSIRNRSCFETVVIGARQIHRQEYGFQAHSAEWGKPMKEGGPRVVPAWGPACPPSAPSAGNLGEDRDSPRKCPFRRYMCVCRY